MKEIIYWQQANIDLVEIKRYIEKDSVFYANKTITEIRKKISNIGTFPYMGRKIPEFNNVNLRELIYESYRILYKVNSKIYILKIFHSSRDILNSIKIFNN